MYYVKEIFRTISGLQKPRQSAAVTVQGHPKSAAGTVRGPTRVYINQKKLEFVLRKLTMIYLSFDPFSSKVAVWRCYWCGAGSFSGTLDKQ